MVAGYTNRAKPLLSADDVSPRVIEAFNRLPFAFVGYVGRTTGAQGAVIANTATAFNMQATDIDYDDMLNDNLQQIAVPSGADGVWQATFEGRQSASSGATVSILRSGSTVCTFTLDTTVRSYTSVPFVVNVGDILTWRYSTAVTANALSSGAKLGLYRLGFQP
jgi:hypothetical protein